MGCECVFPGEISSDRWLGGTRHKIMLGGSCAWIVVPENPRPGKEWFWVPEWPDDFPEQNGVHALLDSGFTMLYINVFGKFANAEALETMYTLYSYIISRGFAAKGAFIGMSMGGLYTFRFVEKYPHTASCIYADAPVCDLNWRGDTGREDHDEVCRAYRVENNPKAMKNHPLSPINAYRNMVAHRIPLLLLLGLADQVVIPENNGLLLADRWKKAGGEIQLITRPLAGHHPHGLDDPMPIIRFILGHSCRVSTL